MIYKHLGGSIFTLGEYMLDPDREIRSQVIQKKVRIPTSYVPQNTYIRLRSM